jgi:hypothetical protein
MKSAIRLFAGICLTAACAGLAAAGELIELPARPGVTQGVYFDSASPHPAWVLILFAGGDGRLALAQSGPRRAGNFVIKTARYWTDAGQATAMFDTPSDHDAGVDDAFRLSPQAAQDVSAAVAAARKRYPGAKVALLSTSRGTITVGSVLKRDPALADAYVLTSPVTQAHRSQPGLSAMQWPGNKARVLVVSNQHDGCAVSPFAAAKSMAAANGFDFIAASSSAATGEPCGPKSPHGYLGIENSVLDAIRKWLMPAP